MHSPLSCSDNAVARHSVADNFSISDASAGSTSSAAAVTQACALITDTQAQLIMGVISAPMDRIAIPQ